MKNNTSRVTVLLMVLTMIGRMTGLFREMMLSYIYGASAMSDAYVVATTFSSVIFAGIAAAILNGYVPIAVEEHEKGNLSRYTNNMLLVTLILIYVFAFILIICLNPILSIMAKGFSEASYNYTYKLSLYILMFSPILCIINILIGYLQIKGCFLISALQSVITNIIMIMVFYVTINHVDALGIGYGFSVTVPFLLILLIAYKKEYRIFSRVEWKNRNIFRTWKLIIPTLGVQLAAQFNSIIDRSFASLLEEGTVSSLKYAFLICTMAVSIIAVSIGTVQYPKLALAFSEKKEEYAVDIFTQAMNHVLLIVVPIVFGTIFLAVPIIRILFEHGAFTAEDTKRTSVLLQIYAFAILGNSFQEIISRILLAAKRAKALFILYTGYVLLNIVFNVWFVEIWKAKGLAFGTTLSTLVSVCVMLFYLKWKYQCFRFAKLGIPFVKILIASVNMTAVLAVLKFATGNVMTGVTGDFLYLIICACVGVGVYFGSLVVQKEKIAMELWDRVKCRLGGNMYGN